MNAENLHLLAFVIEFILFNFTGVADGVGGWRTYGVDPSQFPKSLMTACERLICAGKFCPQKPVEVLSSGYYEVQQDKSPLIGICSFSSLCNTSTIDETSMLFIAKLYNRIYIGTIIF